MCELKLRPPGDVGHVGRFPFYVPLPGPLDYRFD